MRFVSYIVMDGVIVHMRRAYVQSYNDAIAACKRGIHLRQVKLVHMFIYGTVSYISLPTTHFLRF